jgi:hypothetical protein
MCSWWKRLLGALWVAGRHMREPTGLSRRERTPVARTPAAEDQRRCPGTSSWSLRLLAERLGAARLREAWLTGVDWEPVCCRLTRLDSPSPAPGLLAERKPVAEAAQELVVALRKLVLAHSLAREADRKVAVVRRLAREVGMLAAPAEGMRHKLAAAHSHSRIHTSDRG